jgi:pimeloyl-ACP methyl ester carboxylesterase
MSPNAPQELSLSIPGLDLAARAWGPEEGRRVLALHGWLDNAASFDGLARLLPKLRFVALDLPGHGLSEHRHASASYDFITYVADVAAVLDALSWPSCALIGHSLGGGIASCVAGALVDRVERLVVLDGLGPLIAEPEEVPEILEKALAQRRRRQHPMSTRYATEGEAVAQRLRASPDLTAEGARALCARGLKPVPGGLAWRHDPRLMNRSLLRLTEGHVRVFLKRIACPVLVVRPRDAQIYDEDMVQGRIGCLRSAEVLEVAGGHHAHLARPESMAGAISEFLLAPE